MTHEPKIQISVLTSHTSNPSLSRPSTANPDAESSVSSKHPLRIDLRHNNPERGTKIAEDLLECSLYSTRMSSLEGDLSYEKAQLFRKTPVPARVEYESRPSTSGSTGKTRLLLLKAPISTVLLSHDCPCTEALIAQ
jgi:hypothetical protein